MAENSSKLLLERNVTFGKMLREENFLIGCKIGQGSFGQATMWLSKLKESHDDSLYVIQAAEIDKLSSKDLLDLQNSIQLSNELNHQYLLLLHSTFVTKSGYIWTIYPLFNFGSCHDVIAAEFKHGLPILCVAMILRYVLIALEYLHSLGIIHRAVTGNHILVNSNGQICLSGLRYCKKLPADKKLLHTYPAHAKSILPWIAPEILQQNVDGYNNKSDMYSVGITTVELVTGTIPYNKLRPTEILLQKLRGIIPELPDRATLEIMQLDMSTSQTSLEGLEQTNDMMSSPTPFNSLSARRVRSLSQLVENCVQTDPQNRLSANQLRHSTYMRHMKRKTKEKDITEMLKPLNPIQEFISRSEDASFVKQVSIMSIDEEKAGWSFD